MAYISDYGSFTQQAAQEQFGDYVLLNRQRINDEMRRHALFQLAESLMQGVYVAGYKVRVGKPYLKKPGESDGDPIRDVESLGIKVIADLEATPERYLVYAGHAIKKLQRELEQQPTLLGYFKHKWRQFKMLFKKTDEDFW